MSKEEFDALVLRAQEILGASKTFLLSPKERPYLAPAIYALREVPRLNLGTFGVDTSWRMYYDPESVVAWNDVEGIAAIMEHEVWHLLRDHPGRAQAASSAPSSTSRRVKSDRSSRQSSSAPSLGTRRSSTTSSSSTTPRGAHPNRRHLRLLAARMVAHGGRGKVLKESRCLLKRAKAVVHVNQASVAAVGAAESPSRTQER
jgi:hypothetical protein